MENTFDFDQLRTLFQSMREGVIVHDKEGRIIRLNNSACELLGHGHDELIGTTVYDQRWKPVSEKFEPMLPEETPSSQARLSGVPQENRIVGVMARDQLRWFNITAVPIKFDASHRPLETLITFSDVTQEHQMKLELQKKEMEMRTILNAIPSLIGHWDRNLMNLSANAVYEEYFGLSPQKIRGMPMEKLLGPELFKQNLPFITHVLEGIPQEFEREFTTFRGETKHIFVNYFPERLGNTVVGFFVVISDVTRLQENILMERKFRDLAERATQERDKMLAVVSHDLRNPLSVIVTSMDLLRRKHSDLAADIQTSLERVKSSAQSMQRMIEDLLDMHKIETGTFIVDPSVRVRTDLQKYLGEIVEDQKLLCNEKKLRLTFSMESGEASVCIEPRLMQRVLQNLIGNAIKFSPEGTCIAVKARKREDQFVISVEDEGPGIESNLLPKIFDPYAQAKVTSSLGAGLGLTIAKGIVEAHGGSIWVESSPNQGTKFYFTISTE